MRWYRDHPFSVDLLLSASNGTGLSIQNPLSRPPETKRLEHVLGGISLMAGRSISIYQ